MHVNNAIARITGGTTATQDVKSLDVPSHKRYPVVIDYNLGTLERIAAYLGEASTKWPLQLISFDEIRRNVFKLPKKEAMSAGALRTFAGQVRRAEHYLMQKYKKALILDMTQHGARATINDQDIVENRAIKQTKRVAATVKRAADTDALINTKNLQGDIGRIYQKEIHPAIQSLAKLSAGVVETCAKALTAGEPVEESKQETK